LHPYLNPSCCLHELLSRRVLPDMLAESFVGCMQSPILLLTRTVNCIPGKQEPPPDLELHHQDQDSRLSYCLHLRKLVLCCHGNIALKETGRKSSVTFSTTPTHLIILMRVPTATRALSGGRELHSRYSWLSATTRSISVQYTED